MPDKTERMSPYNPLKNLFSYVGTAFNNIDTGDPSHKGRLRMKLAPNTLNPLDVLPVDIAIGVDLDIRLDLKAALPVFEIITFFTVMSSQMSWSTLSV